MTKDQLPVLVIGAGPVGCFIAYRLAKVGIPVRIFEKESAIPNTPRAVGYYGATQVVFQECGLYDHIRAKGFMTSGLCWRTLPIDDGQGVRADKLILHEALETGNVMIQFNSELTGILEEENGITIKFDDTDLLSVTGCYL
ncbi:hypothetical protein N7490_011507 [Penicillium lividum]|nr:hypothetical protein N7490_011507 [Penicillium lividum]